MEHRPHHVLGRLAVKAVVACLVMSLTSVLFLWLYWRLQPHVGVKSSDGPPDLDLNAVFWAAWYLQLAWLPITVGLPLLGPFRSGLAPSLPSLRSFARSGALLLGRTLLWAFVCTWLAAVSRGIYPRLARF